MSLTAALIHWQLGLHTVPFNLATPPGGMDDVALRWRMLYGMLCTLWQNVRVGFR
jgi:uncharacterized membrane protein AbrB (regulator of aidB expression)